MRLIDADALKQKWIFRGKTGKPYRDEIDNAPTIEPKQEWILCSERLPEDLIKREDAIKAIEQLPNAYNGWSDTYDKAYIIGTLEEVPSAKMDGEYIRREDAVRASWKALYDYQDEMETKFRERDDVEFGDWFIHRIFVQGVHGEILNRIVDIPSAEKQGEWIPCSERLPEAGVTVLVSSEGGYVYTSNMRHGEWEYGGRVVAWMPLPEPWKGADDE